MASAIAGLRSLTSFQSYRSHPLRTGLVAAAVVLSIYVLAMPASPTASLGRWDTDHYSHYCASILAWHRGIAVLNKPAFEMCTSASPASLALASRLEVPYEQVCDLPERAGKRPLFLNWAFDPRPYPPGAWLVAAPEALLYAHTGIAFQTLNRLAIVKDLILGHLLVGVLLAYLLGGEDDEERRRWRSIAVLLVPLVYFSIVPFAITGIYDSIAIVCIVWAVVRFDRKQPLAALAFLALASFLHFRSVWYVPLGIYALLELRRDRRELASRRGKLLAVAAGVLLAISAFSLVLVAPFLGGFPHTNPILLWRLGGLVPAHINFILIAAVTLATLAWQRQFLMLVLVAWQLLVISTSVQAQGWHGMFLVPLLAVARWQRARPAAIAVILLLMIGIARVAYLEAAMPGAFFYQLLHGML